MTDSEFDNASFHKGQRCEVRKANASVITQTDLAYQGRITGVDFNSRFFHVISDNGKGYNVRAERVVLLP